MNLFPFKLLTVSVGPHEPNSLQGVHTTTNCNANINFDNLHRPLLNWQTRTLRLSVNKEIYHVSFELGYPLVY